MKTKVLISSIFFIALSVVRGWRRMRYLSSFGMRDVDFLGAFGSRRLDSVLGRKKCTFMRCLRRSGPADLFTALATLPALAGASPPPVLPFGAIMQSCVFLATSQRLARSTKI